MHFDKLFVACALVAASGVALAQPESNVHVASGVGAVMATETVKTTSTVVAIDSATRTVSLRNKQGKVTDLQVGDDVRNFDQIRIGDVVTVEYKQALSVSMTRQTGVRSAIERETIERAPPGAKPGGSIGREVTVTADVVNVNHKAGMVTLNDSLLALVDEGLVEPQEAYMKAVDKAGIAGALKAKRHDLSFLGEGA